MADQIFFEDVSVGDRIPMLSVTVDSAQMFFFSASTYNGHRIHYDRMWATEIEGYQDILVQGPLQAALLARAITDWIGGRGRLVSFSVRNRASAFAGQKLVFSGIVSGVRKQADLHLVDLEIRGEHDGTTLMPGTATVALPCRAEVE